MMIRLWNPLSNFSIGMPVQYSSGVTGENNLVFSLVTINNAENLPPPYGTGNGYKIGISSTVPIEIVIHSITRITRNYTPRT